MYIEVHYFSDRHCHLLDMTTDISGMCFQGLHPVLCHQNVPLCLLQMMIIIGIIAVLLLTVLIGK